MPHPSRFCGCLRINHVKNPFLLLVCVLLAAASLGQTSETAKAKPPVATVDGQTTSRSSGRSQTASHRVQIARVFDQGIFVQFRRGEKLIVVLPEPSLLQGQREVSAAISAWE
jgi:hypothetical protein